MTDDEQEYVVNTTWWMNKRLQDNLSIIFSTFAILSLILLGFFSYYLNFSKRNGL